MIHNEATVDRVVRAIVVAPVAFVAAFAVGIGSVLGVILALVGVVMLVTGAVGFCPLYRVLGVSTCPVDTPTR